jgi:hypothetical protein
MIIATIAEGFNLLLRECFEVLLKATVKALGNTCLPYLL